jgi:hypothetical protein
MFSIMSTTTLRKERRSPSLTPPFFDLDQLAERWHCHRLTALRRLQRLGIKPLKLSQRGLLLFKVTDVERIENSCI